MSANQKPVYRFLCKSASAMCVSLAENSEPHGLITHVPSVCKRIASSRSDALPVGLASFLNQWPATCMVRMGHKITRIVSDFLDHFRRQNVVFGAAAKFAEKYKRQGTQVILCPAPPVAVLQHRITNDRKR